jgi:amino acid transporter
LKEGFGAKGGKLMSFLFVWQTMIQAPLVIASAAIGFAQYLTYIVPLDEVERKIISGSVVVLIIFLLYRKIETIGKISVLLWMGVLITMCCIIAGGFIHGNFLAPVEHLNDGLNMNSAFAAALGFASVKTMYSYLGYYNVCHLGSEIIHPQKNIPKSMFISVAGIAILYLLMNISVASVLPLNIISQSPFVVSEFMQALAGPVAATIITALILWVAFASVFSGTLGYSRIPYAAARDGAFFSVFAKLHPTKHFPYISLLALGCVAFVFSLLFKIQSVINAILAMRILIQFVGQAVGLILLSKREGRKFLKWKMPFYPLPVILAIIMWLLVFISTSLSMVGTGVLVISLGIIVYLLKARLNKEWPFES